AVEADCVRYILMDGDHVSHVEADLSGSDAKQLLAMAADYLNGIDADLSLSSFRVWYDITGWNETRLNLMQDVIGSNIIY
ncbi:MAG: hypothetical protein IKM88_12070, partial [Lachnospiraceae bacterium]|nr:hypothetical protein [Lachnospiraceae bacterium]